jgi:hypothetical protein
MKINGNGCSVAHSFHPHRERYHYDRVLCGWKRYSTSRDASDYGTWINRAGRQILSFAEGDETLITAPTRAAFEAELHDLAVFHRAGR